MKTMGAAGLFTIVPRRVLGGNGFIAPSDQLTKAVIGVGGIGRSSCWPYAMWTRNICRALSMQPRAS